MTSSAVNGLPLWNVTSGRSVTSQTVEVLFGFHSSASPGAVFRFGFTWTSGS